jgi:hypothetical protein
VRSSPIVLGSERPLFDLRSFARQGAARRDHLSRAQLEQLVRTVSRVPEVMVKVSGGAKSPGGVIKHLAYIDRQGELEIETDDGRRLKGDGIEKGLSSDWELEELSAIGKAPYSGRPGRRPEKLVHNIVLSMPQGTDPRKLLFASRDFVREQFALKHRYALALHTDQGHPHVHVVVKAVSEDGERLNIRKATRREWRSCFAEQLRHHGVSANATERADEARAAPTSRPVYIVRRRAGSHAIYATTGAASNVRCAREGFSRIPARQRLLKPGARWSRGITALPRRSCKPVMQILRRRSGGSSNE